MYSFSDAFQRLRTEDLVLEMVAAATFAHTFLSSNSDEVDDNVHLVAATGFWEENHGYASVPALGFQNVG